MAQGFDEILGLYKASVRKSPALMMETISVDSNRGATSRGNSPYDKYASPETRSKVLESRMQEIEAFARNRGLSASAIYALAEAAMRTGKIPDLGQFGLAGDDAVATKQFLISSVLNIAGLEWTDYKGDPVVEDDVEDHEGAHVVGDEPVRPAPEKKSRRTKTTAGGYQMDDNSIDPSRFMAESSEGMRKGTQSATGEYGRARGGRPDSGRISKAQLGVGRTKSRRSGKADAQAGYDDYEAEREDREEHVDVDPSMFMAEGSGGRRSLARRTDAAKKAHDLNVKAKVSTIPGTYDDFHAATDDTRQREVQAMKRERQRLAASPPQGGERMQRMARGGQTIPSGREKTVGSGAPGWGAYNQEVDRSAKKLRAMQNSSVDVDPSMFMAEGSTKAGGYPFAMKKKHYQGHSDDQLDYAHTDAMKAAEAVRDHDPIAHNWYVDDAATIRREMNQRRQSPRKTRVRRDEHINVDPSVFMAEEKGTVGGPSAASLSPNRMSDGGDTPHKLQDYERNNLLSKAVMEKLKKIAGDGVYGYSREDLFRLARERGLLGTEENYEDDGDVFDEEDEKRSEQQAEATGIVSTSTDSNAGSQFAPNPTQYDVEDDLLKTPWDEDKSEKRRRKQEEDARSEVDRILGIEVGDPRNDSWPKLGFEMARLMGVQENVGNPVHSYMTQEEVAAEEKALRERSESDKILGIMPGDPRNENWPKLGGEMARLMNLEDQGVLRGPRGINQNGFDDEPIQEMTTAGSMGGYVGAGMMGGGMTGRTCAMPSYGDSYDLPEDPDERVKALKKMLSKNGLKKPVEEFEEYEPAPNSIKVPIVRSEDYDSHPSRFMKRR